MREIMVYINSDKCTACGACAEVCPQGAISIVDNLAVINQSKCIGCGECAAVCPTDAIRVVEPAQAALGKGGDVMRRGYWFGGGYRGWGRGRGRGPGRGWGRGNPYPFCRFYPWLPRRWWAFRPGYYPQMTPTNVPASMPYWQW
jgi:NAD-dependent dihydropyrimidine dehydrogenase PreA subunit